MTVKQLIKLLKKENPKAEVLIWCAKEDGWGLTEVGYGDAIIGNMTKGYPCKDDFILIPVDIDGVEFKSWVSLDKKIYN